MTTDEKLERENAQLREQIERMRLFTHPDWDRESFADDDAVDEPSI